MQKFAIFCHMSPFPQHRKVLKSFTFWAGGLAGVASAAATHQLDVAKTPLGWWRGVETKPWFMAKALGF